MTNDFDAPTREDLDRAIIRALAGYPVDLESYPMMRQAIIIALISAGVRVRQ